MLAVRPGLQFLLLAAAVVAVECVALASRAYALHPGPVQLAVLVDVCAGLPFAWWLLVVRRGEARPRSGLSDALGEGPLARAVAAELALLWYALFSWGSPAPGGFTAYKRAGWPAIHLAIGICVLAEGLPLHFLLHGPAAVASVVLHIYTLLWLLGDLQALRLRPIAVEDGVLHLRLGLRWEAEIPLAQIASLDDAPAALRLGVLGAANLTLQLRAPVRLTGLMGRQKSAQAIALQVDDPAALRRALSL